VQITIVGTGYVGLVTGACLADTGTNVICVDRDAAKVERLRAGGVPIYEPGLDAVIARTIKRGKLTFSTNLAEALPGSSAAFIAVGTPPNDDGSADLSQVRGVAREIGSLMTDYLVVITKSTVPVGTAEIVRTELGAALATRGSEVPFDVASNPEFLKEGDAVNDFMRPDRIVIGTDSERAQMVIEQIYRPFMLNAHPVIFMDIASAEITKYAANAMLATRISFMNSVAALCEAVGADVNAVRRGIGSDRRIGSQFLYAGAGYGGSCFPKDVRALSESARSLGVDMSLIDAVDEVNNRQKHVAVAKLRAALGKSATDRLDGLHIAVWGLAFKPNTDDVREAPAIVIINHLLANGATVSLYDPVALEHVAMSFAGVDISNLSIAESAELATKDADALMHVTEWNEFRSIDPEYLAKSMRGRVIIDARNALDAQELSEGGFQVHQIGRPVSPAAAGTTATRSA
jgi:UDPglucose 6-dehydrogenase